MKREYEKFKNLATLLGAESEDKTTGNEGTQTKKISPMKFGSPEDYAHLSADERQDLTERMMGMHKSWVNTQAPGSIRGD